MLLPFQVVLAPVALGLILNTYFKPAVSILQPVMPFVAMICTALCIGSPLAINRSQILSAEGLRLIGPVLSFHAVAFTLGYWISKFQPLRQVFPQLFFLATSLHDTRHVHMIFHEQAFYDPRLVC